MAGSFSSIEFENSSDALRAKRGLDCVDFRGKRLNVTWYRKTVADGRAPNLQGHNWWGAYPGQPRNKYRLILLNLPKDEMTMSELLTLAWEAGNSVVFLELIPLHMDIPTTYPLTVDQYNSYKKELKSNNNKLNKKFKLKDEYIIRKENTVKGIIEYAHYDDYKYAIDYIDGRKFKGNIIRILANKNYINLENQIAKQQNEMMMMRQRNHHNKNHNNNNTANSGNGINDGDNHNGNDSRNSNDNNNNTTHTPSQTDSRLRRASSQTTHGGGGPASHGGGSHSRHGSQSNNAHNSHSRHGGGGGGGGSGGGSQSNSGRYQYGGGGGGSSGGRGRSGEGPPGRQGGMGHRRGGGPVRSGQAQMPVPTQHLTREQGPMPIPHGMQSMQGMAPPHHGHRPPPPGNMGGAPGYGNVRGSNAYSQTQGPPKHYNPYHM